MEAVPLPDARNGLCSAQRGERYEPRRTVGRKLRPMAAIRRDEIGSLNAVLSAIPWRATGRWVDP